jgi:hypothetical protein
LPLLLLLLLLSLLQTVEPSLSAVYATNHVVKDLCNQIYSEFEVITLLSKGLDCRAVRTHGGLEFCDVLEQTLLLIEKFALFHTCQFCPKLYIRL